jgi:hypothetical protein
MATNTFRNAKNASIDIDRDFRKSNNLQIYIALNSTARSIIHHGEATINPGEYLVYVNCDTFINTDEWLVFASGDIDIEQIRTSAAPGCVISIRLFENTGTTASDSTSAIASIASRIGGECYQFVGWKGPETLNALTCLISTTFSVLFVDNKIGNSEALFACLVDQTGMIVRIVYGLPSIKNGSVRTVR